jgi:hypothetical protein
MIISKWEKIQLVKKSSYSSKLWHPKILFNLPPCILQIATLQELIVPYY